MGGRSAPKCVFRRRGGAREKRPFVHKRKSVRWTTKLRGIKRVWRPETEQAAIYRAAAVTSCAGTGPPRGVRY